ncbi:unnamed protein product [Coregonus sp. 'balchen']|nr:unnamed protein product [Coregonus sp. 'balchen']
MCVVTGACGFLGERLVRLLLEEGKLSEIHLLDKHVRGDTVVSVFEGDIRDSELLRRACKGASLVFHTASLIDVTGKLDYSELHGVNVKGTQLLLASGDVRPEECGVLHLHQVEVAGPKTNRDPIINGDKNTPYTCSIKIPYCRTKKEAERVTLQAQGEVFQNGGWLATCTLRPMYIYGGG